MDKFGENDSLDEEAESSDGPTDAITSFMHQSGMDSVESPAPLPQTQTEDAEYQHARVKSFIECFFR